jgi:hypothetical protein
MSDLQQLKTGSELERYRAAERLRNDSSPEASAALIQALSDEGVGESPGDYDAPPFLYPVAEAAAESLAGRFEHYSQPILAQARGSETAAFYVARMLRHQGSAGVEGLLELCHHSSGAARAQAVASLWPQYQRSGQERLLVQLLEMLADPETSVTYAAVSQVRYHARAHVSLARADLVDRLLARCLREPQAGLFSEALSFFEADPRVIDLQVELAAAGHPQPCAVLRSRTLTEAQVQRLCQGLFHDALVELLGTLGERAVAAAPRLRELGSPAALLALLAMPSQAGEVLSLLPDLYVSHPATRDRILFLHPDRESLARSVLPRLAPLVGKEYGEAFRGVARFGPLAVTEVPWLVELARLGVKDPLRDSAVELLGEFGEAARPAFAAFYQLLEYRSTRPAVLRALTRLGPVAREFAEVLQVVQLDARREEEELLADALAAVSR